MAGVVREFTAQALAPLIGRLDALEQRVAALPTAPDDQAPAILRLKEDIERRMVEFESSVSETAGEAWVHDLINARLDAAHALEQQAGRSPTPEDLAPLIAAEVARAVSALPRPKDGAPGADGLPGRDGLGIAGMVIDRHGDLIVTMANGDQRSLGCVIGKDGAAGKDGADGLGFEDLTIEYDGDRTLTLKFVRGEQTKAFSFDLPIAIYRGIYKLGANYRAGDSVTYANSQWIARRDTADKPDEIGCDAWQLAVRAGREGKAGRNGKDGTPGPPGPEGRPGRDLTQLGISGQKW